MLYLIEPSAAMRRCNLPTSWVLEGAAAQHGVELSKLDWQPAELQADETTIALALRYGVKCAVGLVLDAGHVALQRHPAEIAESHARAKRSHDAPAEATAWMDRLVPGSAELKRELDERVDESSHRAFDEAQTRLKQSLADQDVDPDLLVHWTELGGTPPEL